MSRLQNLFVTILAAVFISNSGAAETETTAARSPSEISEETTKIHENILIYLLEADFLAEHLVTDAASLTREGIHEELMVMGFLREESLESDIIYTVGMATLYGAGQRVVFHDDGRKTLVSFAQNRQNQAHFIQEIVIDSDGELVRNTVSRLPR